MALKRLIKSAHKKFKNENNTLRGKPKLDELHQQEIQNQKNSDMFFYFYNFSGNGIFAMSAIYEIFINASYMLKDDYGFISLASLPIWSTLFCLWLYCIKNKLDFEI